MQENISLMFSQSFTYDASDKKSRLRAYEKAREFTPELKRLARSSGGLLLKQEELITTKPFVETAKLFHAQVGRSPDNHVAYLVNPKYVKVVVGVRR